MPDEYLTKLPEEYFLAVLNKQFKNLNHVKKYFKLRRRSEVN